MAASPSFSFATPELHRRGFPDAADSDDWHFRDGPSPIQPARFRGEEQDESKTAHERDQKGFMSPFRRRNRLETRLEELQKDVASLTLKLRSNGDRSRSLDASSFLLTPQEEKSHVNTPRAVEQRRRNGKEKVATFSNRAGNMATSTNQAAGTVKVLRELHDVTTERDQLKFELERTKRALKAAEKKGQEAARGKKAYEKLKAHCDSLQESLDLSERIRVRQKKLLQQLQLQQQRQEKGTKTSAKKRPGSADTRSAERRSGSRATASTPPHAPAARGNTHTGYDILDSLVSSRHAGEEDEEDAGLCTHEQAPSEPTAAASRSRTPRSVLKPSTPAKPFRSDFDSLLQVDAPHFSTRRPSRLAANARRPSQTQLQQREAMRQAARWARSRGAAVDISTSTTPLARRTAAAAARPKQSFLAPTQASLRRLHDAPRRGDHERPPFVV